MENGLFRAIGLMSGTSLDGIDAALIETDGREIVRRGGSLTLPYEPAFREKLRACFGNRRGIEDSVVKAVEREMTLLHAEAVRQLLAQEGIDKTAVDFVGFHGQTLWHNPAAGETIQIGDGGLLAQELGIPVVYDLRKDDVLAGGEGAPLVPVYHWALAGELERPVGIINIGGVSNITWIPTHRVEDVVAFDVGPGNALIDDWVLKHFGVAFDENGRIAALGKADENWLKNFMDLPFFSRKPPKSLDRDVFVPFVPVGLGKEDGAATLTMMTVLGIKRAIEMLPTAFGSLKRLYITGGGRKNATMMTWIERETGISVHSVDELGWDGDSLEAELFAYLAVRSHLGLPITFPMTTRAKAPMSGGKIAGL